MKKKLIVSLISFLILTNLFLTSCYSPQKVTTYVNVTFFVTDQQGLPVKNVCITFKEEGISTFTLEDGHSSTLKVPTKQPWKEQEDWFGVIVSLKADGYVPIVIFNFILNTKNDRYAEIMLLTDDGTLPYCAYVEIPSAEAIRRVLL